MTVGTVGSCRPSPGTPVDLPGGCGAILSRVCARGGLFGRWVAFMVGDAVLRFSHAHQHSNVSLTVSAAGTRIEPHLYIATLVVNRQQSGRRGMRGILANNPTPIQTHQHPTVCYLLADGPDERPAQWSTESLGQEFRFENGDVWRCAERPGAKGARTADARRKDYSARTRRWSRPGHDLVCSERS